MHSFPIHEFEIRVASHREELLREAAMERLARQAPSRGGQWKLFVRARLAAALYAVAARIDASAAPMAISPAVRPARSVSINGTS